MTADAFRGSIDRPADEAGRLAPREIRDRLTPESRSEFDRQWRGAMSRAIEALDLTEVLRLLEGWERVAVLTERLGPEGYRTFLRDAHTRTEEQSGPGTAEIRYGADDANSVIRARLAAS